jgi:hypothetical protein
MLGVPGATFFTAQTANDWIILSLLDLQSFLLLALSYAIIKGSELKLPTLWIAVVLATCVMLLYNVVLYQFPLPDAGRFVRYAYAAPSGLLSSIAFISLGYAFIARWGAVAAPMLIATFVYALVELPIYIDAVVLAKSDARWFVVLACAKIVLGSFFYLYVTAPLKDYAGLGIVISDPAAQLYIKAKFQSGWLALWGFILAIVVTVIANLITG